MTAELAGKVAIITGASNGLGRASAEVFVEEGARVVIADIDEARGQEAARALGDAARFRRTDVSNAADMQALVDFAVSEFGALHVMYNNAGMSDQAYGSFLEQDFAQFDRIMRVNILGVMLGTQLAARHMAQHGGGSIINTASIAGVRGGHGFPMYRSAKAGIIHFTKSVAIELGPHLIRVNCICPGNIPTQMGTYAASDGMSQATADRLQNAIKAVRMSVQPLKRQGEPRDIGQAALFLASDRSRQVSGQILSVDGAATAGDARSLIQAIMDARAEVLKSQ
jgi:NAD(P)-dependent dehydrogenase (short-subunit alcohol dehydrogenase family)